MGRDRSGYAVHIFENLDTQVRLICQIRSKSTWIQKPDVLDLRLDPSGDMLVGRRKKPGPGELICRGAGL